MHPRIIHYLLRQKAKWPEAFTKRNVVEIGSANINGTVRTYFSECKWLGLDLGEGPGVDLVCHAKDMTEEHFGQYDTVISAEALEHDRDYAETIRMMLTLAKPGGAIIMTCASTNRPEHGTSRCKPGDSKFTNDHYLNITEEMFRDAIPNFEEQFASIEFEQDDRLMDLYFFGIKA